MRVKGSDMSVTMSEFPNQHHHEERNHSHDDREEVQMQSFDRDIIERPKSSMGIGRKKFNGTISSLKTIDNQKSLKKGKKMLALTSMDKETRQQVHTMKSRIENLKRQSEKSQKRVEKIEETKKNFIKNKQSQEYNTYQKQQREQKRIKEQQEKNVKIQSIKQNQELQRKMTEESIVKKLQQNRIQSKNAQSQRKQQLYTQDEKIREEKIAKTQRIKNEKFQANQKRKSEERDFHNYLQYQYHNERKQKRENIEKTEAQLRYLEEAEQEAVDNLKRTMAQEQRHAHNLRDTLEQNKRQGSFHQEPRMKNSVSVDMMQIYQTPRTTHQLAKINQGDDYSQKKSFNERDAKISIMDLNSNRQSTEFKNNHGFSPDKNEKNEIGNKNNYSFSYKNKQDHNSSFTQNHSPPKKTQYQEYQKQKSDPKRDLKNQNQSFSYKNDYKKQEKILSHEEQQRAHKQLNNSRGHNQSRDHDDSFTRKSNTSKGKNEYKVDYLQAPIEISPKQKKRGQTEHDLSPEKKKNKDYVKSKHSDIKKMNASTLKPILEEKPQKISVQVVNSHYKGEQLDDSFSQRKNTLSQSFNMKNTKGNQQKNLFGAQYDHEDDENRASMKLHSGEPLLYNKAPKTKYN